MNNITAKEVSKGTPKRTLKKPKFSSNNPESSDKKVVLAFSSTSSTKNCINTTENTKTPKKSLPSGKSPEQNMASGSSKKPSRKRKIWDNGRLEMK
jgi:hypothetical protein